MGIYSPHIHSFLYLPDYRGHISRSRSSNRSIKWRRQPRTEFERMSASAVCARRWIQGNRKPVGAEALLEATKQALVAVSTGQ